MSEAEAGNETVADAVLLGPRVSALPGALYQATHLASARAADERDGFYLGMLKDDLRKQRYAYEITLTITGTDVGRGSGALMALLDDFDHMGYGRDPAAIVCAFTEALLDESLESDQLLLELYGITGERMRSSARRYAYQGSTGLERPDGEAPLKPSLAYLPGWSVTQRRGAISQAATTAAGRPVALPRARIRRVGMREANRKRWRQTVHDLRQVDASKVLGSLDRYSWQGYLFAHHVAAEYFAVASTTAPIGWDARGTFSESVTSPYMAFRRLRFARFWVETVEDSVSFLNHITSDTAVFGDDTFNFSVSGLPTSADLGAAMRGIRDGSLTFEEAHNTFLSPRFKARRVDDSAQHATGQHHE